MFDKQQRFAIYNAIISQGDFLGTYAEDQGIMSFLSSVWQLRGMESEDSRFSNAYDDAFQHLVNNNDWDDERTYLKRFKLIDGDEDYFIKFVELVVHPNTRGTSEDVQRYVAAVNKVIGKSQYALIVSEYYNELPIYKFGEKKKAKDRSEIIARNKLLIYKDDSKNKKYPCLTLERDFWDDYTHKTLFTLFYQQTPEESFKIGPVKIMKRGAKVTWDVIPETFFDLSEDYCSLGQDENYYRNLKTHFADTYQAILLALRDTAFYPVIYESFENDDIYKRSVIRDNDVEKLRRSVRADILGDPKEGYKFSYIFLPPYGDSDGGLTNLYFDFRPDAIFPQRIVALIGKNGVGKTRILSSLIDNLRRKTNNIVPNDLLFGKYFTVSYSVFDKFQPPNPDTSFNYVYCGLKKDPSTIKSQQEQLAEFYEATNQIGERELLYEWYQILSAFLSSDHLKIMFPNYEQESDYSMATFNAENFRRIENQFSSGESILLFVTTKIVSEIREESLILYDEPETHLHPNAISDLMTALARLLDRFNSFCIIATHSPLVVRELHPNNVIVLIRIENGLEASMLSIDSFGQNLTVIIEQIFGNKEVNKLHLERIRTLVQERRSFNEIIGILQDRQIPVNLNTRLFLSSLIDDRG